MSTGFSEEEIAMVASRLFREGTPMGSSMPSPNSVDPRSVNATSTMMPSDMASASLPASGDLSPTSLPNPFDVSHAAIATPAAMPNPAAHGVGHPASPAMMTSHQLPRPSVPSTAPSMSSASVPSMPGQAIDLSNVLRSPSYVSSNPQQTNVREGIRAFVQQVRTTGIGDSPFRSQASSVQAPTPASSHAGFASTPGPRPFDPIAIRAEFPIFQQRVHGKPLIWLDNAATTQKPQCVIDAISNYYRNDNSNIHRAAHTLAARSTDAYEGARDIVRDFLGAGSSKEIVFVRGTTEGINLIANIFGEKFIQPGDEILLSMLEHHANIVPWQMVSKRYGANIRVIPVNDRGEIIMTEYERLLSPKTRLVALTHASNSLGTILPIEEMTRSAKRYGAKVLIDGAQSVSHIAVNMQSLGCDFFVFSGHKIFGPTGIGAVYIKEELHELLPPWQGGGNMIRDVHFEHTEYADAPAKFEAGTPNIADAIGLGQALRFVSSLGLPNIAKYEHDLLAYATEAISRIPGLRIFGTAAHKVGVISLVSNQHEPTEIGKMLDAEGIAVRSGHHCSQPSLRRFGLEATVRPSLSIYNTHDEVDHLVRTLRRIQGVSSV